MNADISACVLVVEFDPLQRDLIVLTLNRNAYQPVVCRDTADIRLMIKEHQPGIILVDLYLPGLNSMDLLRSLSQEGLLARRAVIAISAFGFKEVVRQAIEAGVDDFLVKPVQPELLLARIQKVVEKKHLA